MTKRFNTLNIIFFYFIPVVLVKNESLIYATHSFSHINYRWFMDVTQ